MADYIDTVLLLALPASGKSEVRKFMESYGDQMTKDFHIAHTVQIDDYPYVQFVRRIDEELVKLGQPTLIFTALDGSFRDPVEWGTLVAMLNEDYANLTRKKTVDPPKAGVYLMERLEKAREAAGGKPMFASLSDDVRRALADALEQDARQTVGELNEIYAAGREGQTVVIEFARGGPHGAEMPLKPPHGYQYNLSVLSDEILDKSSILYIWVTPEESRRKNIARTKPGEDSILHHGVPEVVMMGDYGCDDIEHLMGQSDRPDTVRLTIRGQQYRLPIVRLDNRVDMTSFVRDVPQPEWGAEDVDKLYAALRQALRRLYDTTRSVKG